MKQRLLYAALGLLALAVPAGAEPLRLAQAREPGALPPQEIVSMLRSTGLDPLGQPVRRGPNYVLRAVDDTDREVRVVVDAHSGDVRSVTPVQTASRMPPGPPPRGGVSLGPYERMPPGYIPPDGYRPGAPIVEEDDGPPPRLYGTQPPAPIPNAPPRIGNAAPPPVIGSARPSDEDDVSSGPPDPRVITATPERDGMLPPPPERFPQRVAPAAPPKPKPAKRAAVTTPKAAPLPKPKPAAGSETPAPQSWPTTNEPAQAPANSAPANSAPADETPN